VGSGTAAIDPFPAGAVRPLAELEKMAIEHALRVCEGNKTRAASMLGIARQTLRTKLKEYAIADDAEDAET
jgi:two-component system nitrogen regulation response regulator GlnG